MAFITHSKIKEEDFGTLKLVAYYGELMPYYPMSVGERCIKVLIYRTTKEVYVGNLIDLPADFQKKDHKPLLEVIKFYEESKVREVLIRDSVEKLLDFDYSQTRLRPRE